MVKLRSITLYRILPIVLILVLLFSICLCSNVFSPKPARAIVGEEFILPAFYGWLNASNVFINTYNSDSSDTQYLANGVANTLVDVANAIAFLNSSVWTRSALLSELASRTDLVPNDDDIFYFQLDQETSTLFDSATRQFIIDNSLSSDISTPVDIDSESVYKLLDGSPVIVANTNASSNNPPSNFSELTKFNYGEYYTTSVNSIFRADLNTDGSVTVTTNLNGYTYTTIAINSNFANSPGYYLDTNGYGRVCAAVYRGSSTITVYKAQFYTSSNHYITNYADLFGNVVTVGYEATTGSIVQNPTLPDDDEDEYGYVSIPAGVGAGTASTGLELLQSMLDYERDKPYSQTSEYTYTISNELPIQPEPEEPGMVELPLIGIKLPLNFSLNLRGIWYYVVQWVNSISTWFTWMFGVFANLPYAMVVPIYASAVVVIVLGVYKRFFM